jgi:hypothetical protein
LARRDFLGAARFFPLIDIAKIVFHKTDQPDAVVDFFDADGLSCRGHAEIDLFIVQAKTSATGDHDGAIVERVMRFWDSSIRAAGSRVDLGRAFSTANDIRSGI